MRPLRTAAALLLLASCGACEPLAGPEAQVASFLQRCARAPADCSGADALVMQRVSFDRLLVKPERDGWVAVTTVDVEATWRGTVTVSHLGLERIPFVREGRRLVPAGPLLPALAEVTALLDRRQRALAERDTDALEALVSDGWSDPRMDRAAMLAAARGRLEREEPPPAARRWAVRAERHEAEVLEEAVGPAGRVVRTRFVLRRDDGMFRFASGLL